jgi:hypothetical protein
MDTAPDQPSLPFEAEYAEAAARQRIPVLTVDNGTAVLHLRTAELNADGSHRRYLVDERCQTDQSGAWTELREAGAFQRRCQHCFD